MHTSFRGPLATDRDKPGGARAAQKGMSHLAVSTRAALRLTALAFSAVLGLTACSNGGNGGQVKAPRTTGATRTAPVGTQVTLTETEFALKLSRTSFTPGTYTFTADNAGKAAHALEVEGPGVSEAKTATIQGGQKATVTVTLKKGTYELYCPVSGHKELGMDKNIQVG